jgi:hypothetical protein
MHNTGALGTMGNEGRMRVLERKDGATKKQLPAPFNLTDLLGTIDNLAPIRPALLIHGIRLSTQGATSTID